MCPNCGAEVPQERVELGYNSCVNCSTTQKKVGFMVFPHKTGGSVQIIDPKNTEVLRQANRANERAR